MNSGKELNLRVFPEYYSSGIWEIKKPFQSSSREYFLRLFKIATKIDTRNDLFEYATQKVFSRTGVLTRVNSMTQHKSIF